MASARELLDSVYDELGLREGELIDAASSPQDGPISDAWIDKGEWLALAKSVGVEKVFFVQDNPVVVFATAAAETDEAIRLAVNSIWCMARPQCLFFARPGELLVFDLTRPPIGPSEQYTDHKRLLRRVESIADVQEQLSSFRREVLESGNAPEGQGYFSPGEARADKALVRDLKLVREALMTAGLDGENAIHANSLIGRSLFIRYLEDRRILLESDFEKVAKRRKRWDAILKSSQGVPFESSLDHVRYTKLLSDKNFTYAFFKQLSQDFNGDLFPVTKEEEEAVSHDHLRILQRFLRGEITDSTKRLFFFAYRFEFIPIELISSIYEEFYNAGRGVDQNHGTHYTPIELVEYLLSKILTKEVLAGDPTVLDPACGSGIFLVETFRRIVRYRQVKQKRRLGLRELSKILRDQLRGIDINGEAVRVAAFSLYLALLHHLDPPDIWRDKRLPHLTHDPQATTGQPNRFDVLFVGNSFDIDESSDDSKISQNIADNSIDVIVGNPPWGYPKRNDRIGRIAARQAAQWCSTNNCEVGDLELSQAFIHRAIKFLRPGGSAALLVSTGVFFKHHQNSKTFRRQWLTSCSILHVINFSAVRNLYFNSAVAPFASVVFQKNTPSDSHIIEYWSAKSTLQAKQMRAVVLSLADRRLIPQYEAVADDRVWKIFWWGSHHDYALVQQLEVRNSLEKLVGIDSFGQGFKESNKEYDSDWLNDFLELPTQSFTRYGPLPREELTPVPLKVERFGVRNVYEGRRLLIKRGITQSAGYDGLIEARVESEPFAFRNSIHGVNVSEMTEWQCDAILAIFWSSLARYYLWMTAGGWGMWHHEIHMEDVRRMPIVFPDEKIARKRITQIVKRLRETYINDQKLPLDPQSSKATISRAEVRKLEYELDELVFDSYELGTMQRDLIRDMCRWGLNLFYRNAKSEAVQHLLIPKDFTAGKISILSSSPQRNDIIDYVKTFGELWNQELGGHGEFAWHVVRPHQYSPMIALLLETIVSDREISTIAIGEDGWNSVLSRLSKASLQHTGSRRLYVDGMVRVVGETEVLIIKRNERRQWTASMAREDAEATIKQAMQLQESLQGSI
ncbi:HsdM family class I SAM-dependent methyltransferase [Gimesia sp.]|uniref:HsdM family class I SAM-dependent methyltransferase n=1 Tax=Gimesia sp. TaxID=2024833 RepID=UPI003A954492